MNTSENINGSEYHNYTKAKTGNEKKYSKYYPAIVGMTLLFHGVLGFLIYFVFDNVGYFNYETVGVIQLIPSSFLIISGILAIMKKQFKIVVLASIVSIIYLVIPGIISFILLFFSEDEFES